MIITCPACATRYDLDDDRFLPAGRSVRCTECEESWFVPAPEPLEAAAILEKTPRDPESRGRRAAFPREDGHLVGNEWEAGTPPVKTNPLGSAGRDHKSARDIDTERAHTGAYDDSDVGEYDLDDFYEEEDDSLFDSPVSSSQPKADPLRTMGDYDRQHGSESRDFSESGEDLRRHSRENRSHTNQNRAPGKRGRGYSVREQSQAFRGESNPEERRTSSRENQRKSNRRRERTTVDARDIYGENDLSGRSDDFYIGEGGLRDGDAPIVDADWEDVDEAAARGFGRRVRADRRRATAIARIEDARRFEPDMFDDEFFASLQVTPRELERAMRKARRRAESREKNRLTPWRAVGWSAWLAVIIGAAYAVVVYRDEIVKVAPSAAEAYAVVGIETNPGGLKIENISHRLAMSTAGPVIEITGALRNQGDEAVDAPLLQAEALGPRGELLSRWTFTPAEPTVGAKGVVTFITRNEAPEGVSEVALSLAPAGSAAGAISPPQGE
ncbi:MAG: zinc-ribbon domain-containing protein [Pseudomonadota bacterium]